MKPSNSSAVIYGNLLPTLQFCSKEWYHQRIKLLPVCSWLSRKLSKKCSEQFNTAHTCFVIPKFNFLTHNQPQKYDKLNTSDIKRPFLLTIDYLSSDNLSLLKLKQLVYFMVIVKAADHK